MARNEGHTRRHPRARRAWLNRRGLIDRSLKTSWLYGRPPVPASTRKENADG